MNSQRSDHRVPRAIAILKLAKVCALLLIAAAAVEVASTGVLTHLVEGAIACCYTVLFAVSGFGLSRERRWAEYLTVIATASLVPFEAWAICKKATPLRGVALLANIAIVICVLALSRCQRGARARRFDGAG